MKRRTRQIVASVLTLTAIACASPPSAPVTATGVIPVTGRWSGQVPFDGAVHSATLTIRADGTWTNEIPTLPPGTFSGRAQLEQGHLRFRSDTTGRTGTFVVQEGAGQRVLIMKGDDGMTHEYRPVR